MGTPPSLELPAPPAPRRLSSTQALWLNGLILMSFLAASSVPSPLYAIYRAMWGFSALTLTVVFASYAIAMLGALLVFGALSDYRGRREVIVGALVLEIGAILLFWRADSVGWLLAARVLQGVATGLANAALSAALLDLHRDRGSVINSVAPMAGLGLGALGASVLVQFAPAPTRLVFDVLLLVFAAQLVAAFFLPDTAPRRLGAWRSLRPSLAVPAKARATLLRVLPVNIAGWAMGGFYFSLGPTLARAVTGNDAPIIGGLLIATLSLGSAAMVGLARGITPRAAIAAGGVALAAGALVTLAGIHGLGSAAAVVGTALSGAGFGAAFNGSLRSLVPLALPHERAGLMAAFFAASYLSFSVPAVIAGLLAGRYGLQPTALGYGLAASAVALASLLPFPARRPSIIHPSSPS